MWEKVDGQYADPPRFEVFSETEATLGELSPASQLKFTVAALNEIGEGKQSPEVETTTLTRAPDAPTNVKVGEVTDTSVSLSWTAPKEDGGHDVTSY